MAYNKLEKVSEIGIEEEEDDSDGSSSDPSGDNLDLQEIFASVYHKKEKENQAKKLKSEREKQARCF